MISFSFLFAHYTIRYTQSYTIAIKFLHMAFLTWETYIIIIYVVN
jgi:hypothetical protein